MREQASRNPLSHTVGRAEPRPAFPPPPTTSTPTSQRCVQIGLLCDEQFVLVCPDCAMSI